MKNLAGDSECDKDIEMELRHAGIELVRHAVPSTNEVPASITGVLTLDGSERFKFTRAWYYWVVKGNVPMGVAKEIYHHPAGRDTVRVDGHCMCPAPDYIDGRGFIDLYHIDSEAGLLVFAMFLRKNGLIDPVPGLWF